MHRYRKHWWGSFVDTEFERLYRQRLWKISRVSRRGGVFCTLVSACFHAYLIGSSFLPLDGASQPTAAVPSVVACVVSLVILLGLTSQPWVIHNWSAVSFVALTPFLASSSSA